MAHVPVLLSAVLEYLDPKPGEAIIDGTINGGGHAAAILERIGARGKLLGVDWDKQLIESSPLASFANVSLAWGNYRELPAIMAEQGFPKADGLLIDLGFSSEQLERSKRGFSFKKEYGNEPLLMTYSDEETPVRTLLKTLREHDLAVLIRTLGGERYAGRIARAIHELGRKRPIHTAGELAECIANAVPKGYERGRINPATRTFQALRIYANHELENLEIVLERIPHIVRSGGRVVIISFHSLEDARVKHAFQDGAKHGRFTLLTKKPVGPTADEEEENPRARSAKLRAIRVQ